MSDDAALIDEQLAEELFSSSQGPDAVEMQQDIWQGVRNDLLADLERATTPGGSPDTLRENLHRIRGYAATCALSRLGSFLADWEKSDPDPVASAPSRLPAALELAKESIGEIERRYPHLASPA